MVKIEIETHYGANISNFGVVMISVVILIILILVLVITIKDSDTMYFHLTTRYFDRFLFVRHIVEEKCSFSYCHGNCGDFI